MSGQRISAFLANLRASGLVDSAQLAQIANWPAAQAGNDRALAQELVLKGVLTRFQGERLLAGRTGGFVVGPYVVTDKIGVGGMGRVYKAVHRELRRTVALKVLPKAHRADPVLHARFLREARAGAKLCHPNIVTTYGVGEQRNVTYLAMEYVKGRDVYRLIRQHGKLTPTQAAGIAYQVASALQHACEHGVVHRDIKPGNILVDRQGTAKVLDMGLARIEGSDAGTLDSALVTSDGVTMGTVDYLAPEQARDTHSADIRADIYSLGCTLYHMLTGRVPFADGTPTDRLLQRQMDDPPPVTDLEPDLPQGLSEVVARMCARKLDDRYQTPAEVAEALLPWVDPSLVDSESTPPPTQSGLPSGAPTRRGAISEDDPEDEPPGPPSVSQTTPPARSGRTLAELVAMAEADDEPPPSTSWGRPADLVAEADEEDEPVPMPEPPRSSVGAPTSLSAWQRVPAVARALAIAGVVLIAAIVFWPGDPGEPVDPPDEPEPTTAVAPDSGTQAGPHAAAPPEQLQVPGTRTNTGAPPDRLKPEAWSPKPDLPVVRADGSGKGPYETLTQAFADIGPDDDVVIELRTNALVHGGLTLQCRRVTLRAGEGYRPILYANMPRPPGGKAVLESRNILMLRASQSIHLARLHFVARSPGMNCCVVVRSPTVQVQGCTFRHGPARGSAGIMAVTPTRQMTVRDCLFGNTSAVRLTYIPSGRIEVVNCAACSAQLVTVVRVSDPGHSGTRLHVRLERNTRIGAQTPFWFERARVHHRDPQHVRLELVGNVLLPVPGHTRTQSLTNVPIPADARDPKAAVAEHRRAVQWRGRDNLIGHFPHAVVTSMHKPPSRTTPMVSDLRQFLQDWAPDLAATRLESAVSPYTTDQVPWHTWRRTHFEHVHQQLPSGVGDVGADLSRVPDPPDVSALW